MDQSETTHAILREIRDQLKTSNERIDRLNVELAQTRQDLGRRIDQTNRQLVTTETRLVTEISALRSAVTETQPDRLELRERVSQCERDIAELRAR